MTTMTDREMLELAAKAAGMSGTIADYDDRMVFLEDGKPASIEWNPLTDDADAFRLAANLRLIVRPGKHLGDGCSVDSQQSGIAGCTAFRDDKAEQMRFAIVRVAAEIGKDMP